MIRWMRVLLKLLLGVLVLGVIGLGGAWLWAGRMDGPKLEIRQPQKFVGQNTPLELMAQAPEGRFSKLEAVLEQGGKTFPIYSLAESAAGAPQSGTELYISRPLGKRSIPELKSGPARVVVHASRPVLYGLRDAESSLTRDV